MLRLTYNSHSSSEDSATFMAIASEANNVAERNVQQLQCSCELCLSSWEFFRASEWRRDSAPQFMLIKLWITKKLIIWFMILLSHKVTDNQHYLVETIWIEIKCFLLVSWVVGKHLKHSAKIKLILAFLLLLTILCAFTYRVPNPFITGIINITENKSCRIICKLLLFANVTRVGWGGWQPFTTQGRI